MFCLKSLPYSVCSDSSMSEGSLQLESFLFYPSKFDFHLNHWLLCIYSFNVSTFSFYAIISMSRGTECWDFLFISSLLWGGKSTFISLYLNTLTFSNFIYCVSKVSKDCLCSERARTQQKQQTASMLGVIFIITSFDLLYSAVLLFLFQALHRISYLVSFVGSSAFSHAALHHQDSAYIYFPFLFLFQYSNRHFGLWNFVISLERHPALHWNIIIESCIAFNFIKLTVGQVITDHSPPPPHRHTYTHIHTNIPHVHPCNLRSLIYLTFLNPGR